MILIDISQLCLASTFVFSKDLRLDSTTPEETAKGILRHVILSQIKSYKKKFGEDYGEVVISCDAHHYWRKKLFPNYKIGRKKAREESPLNWKLIFDTISEIISDLRENFTYKVVYYNEAESDDIIAVLTKHFSETTHEPILIVSSDKDFIQLHKFPNVKQISPQSKKFVTSDDPVQYLKEKIVKGDPGDGVPNIFSSDDFFLTEEKAPPVTKKRLQEYTAFKSYDDVPDPVIRERLKRNATLISFDYIPADVEKNILEEYNKPINGNKAKIFDYLKSKKCVTLLRDIDSF